MKACMDLAESTQFNACIDLSRCNRRVPEHLLDDAEVGAAGQQVGREAMAERVRADLSMESGGLNVRLDQPPEPDPRKGPALP